MIRGFLFDYDGVMTNNNEANTPPSEKLANVLQLPASEVNDIFLSVWPDYLRGRITDEELWSFIEEQTNQVVPPAQRDIWSKWEQLKPLPEMQELVAALHREDYPVGLLTNVTPTTEQEVREGGGYEGFDFSIKSCEVGYAKPDGEVYAMALQHFKSLTPQEVVYIDDRERFLVPARVLGMTAILSTNSQQVISDINRLLSE
jgi:putative hydrolase of the HAD superfamily